MNFNRGFFGGIAKATAFIMVMVSICLPSYAQYQERPKPKMEPGTKDVYYAQMWKFRAKFPNEIELYSERDFTNEKNYTTRHTRIRVASPILSDFEEYGIYSFSVTAITFTNPRRDFRTRETKLMDVMFDQTKKTMGDCYKLTQLSEPQTQAEGKWVMREMRLECKEFTSALISRLYVFEQGSFEIEAYFTTTKKMGKIVDKFFETFEVLDVATTPEPAAEEMGGKVQK